MKTSTAAKVATLVAVLTLARSASADTVRYVISMGNDLGYSDEPRLRYASDDAARIVTLLDGLGDVPPERVFLLQNQSIAGLKQALQRVARLAAQHRPDQVTLLFYFSGHGDENSLHIGPHDLSMDRLQELIRTVEADQRVVVVDACRSGDPSLSFAPDGLARGPDRSRARAAPTMGLTAGPRDMVLIRSSGEGEAAQESDELTGGVFTHYWINGLRGAADQNGDRRVGLKEAFDYAYVRTVQRGAEQGRLQRPTAGPAMAGSAGFVLTDPTRSDATIVLPPGAKTRYRIFGLPRGKMVAEAWTTIDGPARLAVPPGRYLVQRESRHGYAAAEISMPWGGESALRYGDFESRHALSLSALSRAQSTRNHELSIGYGGSMTGDAIGHGAELRYGYRFESVALTLGINLGMGIVGTDGVERDHNRLAADARLEWRGRFDPIELRLGAGAQVAALRQTLGDEVVDRLAYGPVVAAELQVPISDHWKWRLNIQGSALLTKLQDGYELRPGVLLTTGPGWEW